MHDVQTVQEAFVFLREKVRDQVSEAQMANAEPNVAIKGDLQTKAAFWSLLSPDDQRALFLGVVGDRKVWPRIKPLFGAPPFSFLRPEDEGILNASGIQKNRVRMAHADVTTTNYSEFTKAGHLEDLAGRVYRVIAKENANRAELPWKGLSGHRVVADVRLPRTSLKKRAELLRGDQGPIAQAGAVFPRPGDVITLHVIQKLQNDSIDDGEGARLRARVESGRIKSSGSLVARLVLNFE